MYSHSFCLETLPRAMNIFWHMWPRTQVQMASVLNKMKLLIKPGEDETLSKFRCRERRMFLGVCCKSWYCLMALNVNFSIFLPAELTGYVGNHVDRGLTSSNIIHQVWRQNTWQVCLSDILYVSLTSHYLFGFPPPQLVKAVPERQQFLKV